MKNTYDAIILGAGIVGAACALEFVQAAMNVAVIERDAIGSGATAAGMGHIVVMDDSPAQFALTSYSQSLWNALEPELPANVEYLRCGTIWVAADDEEMLEVHRKLAFYTSRNLSVEALDATSLAEAEPKLRRGLAGGLRVVNDAVLYPPSAAAYLLQKARQQADHKPRAGLNIYLGQAVTSAGNGVAILQDGTVLHSPILVNATGALSPALTPGIAVRKRKGHLIITDRYPGFVSHQLVELGYLKSAHASTSDSVAFNVQPRKTGQLLIGSSRQFDAEDAGVDREIVAAMIQRAELYMPEIAKLSALRVWSGFRAATPDKLPLIGPTQDDTLFLATGHEGLGITTSLATARLLVDSLLGRPTAIPLEPYLPARISAHSEVAHA